MPYGLKFRSIRPGKPLLWKKLRCSAKNNIVSGALRTTHNNRPYCTLVLHKIPAQNRCAASIAASKTLYSLFLNLT